MVLGGGGIFFPLTKCHAVALDAVSNNEGHYYCQICKDHLL